MYQSVEMTSGFLNLLPHIVVAVKIEDICYKIESILVVLDLCIEACKVEAIREVFLVDFAEVLVPARRYELRRKLALLSSNRMLYGKQCKERSETNSTKL